MKFLVEMEINEPAAEQAVRELRRLKGSFEAAAKLRIDRGEMSAPEAFAKTLPLSVALNICSAVSLALSDPEPFEVKATPAKRATPATPATPADSPLCCLCDAPGLHVPASDAWRCSNMNCPRFNCPLPKCTFDGSGYGAQKTPQDRAGALAEKPEPSCEQKPTAQN